MEQLLVSNLINRKWFFFLISTLLAQIDNSSDDLSGFLLSFLLLLKLLFLVKCLLLLSLQSLFTLVESTSVLQTVVLDQALGRDKLHIVQVTDCKQGEGLIVKLGKTQTTR